jgi:NADPH-dependent curcumin reductase
VTIIQGFVFMAPIAEVSCRFVLKSRPVDLPSDENFSIETVPVKMPGDGQVLVKVLIAALSPWQNQRLKDFKNYTKPFEIGELIDCDVLGQVVAGDAGGLHPGQMVTGRLGWREYALATPGQLLAVTDEFPDTLWLTALSSPGLTAYCGMDLFARPMPGQTMVVTSAAGSVGGYAVQLGKLAGMRVVGIAGGARKCGLVSDHLGADVCVDYQAPGFAEQLAAACPGGVNLFFDTLGGPIADTVFDNLAKYAKVLVVGRTVSNNGDRPDLDPVNMRQLWAREATIQGFSRYSYPERWDFAREQMMALCRQGLIKTMDHLVDGFEKTPNALRDMLSGQCTGKVLVRYAEADKSGAGKDTP